MKVLIVGGTGFIGSQIGFELRKAGYMVKSLNRKLSPVNVDQSLGDIAKRSSYIGLLRDWKPNVVIQTAWVTEQANYRNSLLNREYSMNTFSFAEDCFQSGVGHFVCLGSSAEYGNQSKACVAGITATDSLDLYSLSKIEAMEKLLTLASRYSQRITWARIFQAYGLNQDPHRLVPSSIQELRSNRNIEIQNPHHILDWISTRDIASAIEFSLSHELPNLIDIGTGTGTSVLTVLTKIADLLKCDPRLLSPNNTSIDKFPFSLVVGSESPLFRHGWKPQDDIEKGLSWILTQ